MGHERADHPRGRPRCRSLGRQRHGGNRAALGPSRHWFVTTDDLEYYALLLTPLLSDGTYNDALDRIKTRPMIIPRPKTIKEKEEQKRDYVSTFD